MRALLAQFAVVAFVVLGTALVLGKLAVDTVIDRVEQQEVEDKLQQSRLAFDRLARRARLQVEDYAFWDETVRLAQHPGTSGASGFFRRNFVEWLPRNDYQFIDLLDDDRTNVFEWSETPEVKRPVAATERSFLDHLAKDGSSGGYVREGGHVYLVAGAAVRSSRRTGASPAVRGYLIIGRPMDDSALVTLTTEPQFSTALLPPDAKLAVNQQHAEFTARGDSLSARWVLDGIDGAPAAVVELRDSRSGVDRVSRATAFGALAALLFGGAAFLFVWQYGRRLLIVPLRAISSEIEAMHGRGELSAVESAPPSTEWALFLSTFNDTVRSLGESEQRYRALFDHSVDPYFLLDATSRLVVDANPAAAALTTLPRTSLVGAPVPSELHAAADSTDAVRVRRADGIVQTWGVVETEIILDGRRLVLAAYRDLTDREALAHSQKMDAVGSLAGGLAHEFNNLMGSVLAGVRVARDNVPAEPRSTAALNAIEHAGQRAADLTRQLLGVSRHEPLVRVPVDVGTAMANIQRMCESTFDRRIQIVVEHPEQVSAVDTDPGQLEQALLNLCINGRDAMPAGGTLRLAARRERVDDVAALALQGIAPGGYVVLSVEDDGVGMADDIKQRVFEPFFTTKQRGKGTGLGLAMVYGYARSAEGTVAVTSAEGRGTRFDVYLKASTAAIGSGIAPPIAAPTTKRADGTTRHRPLILLADDETGLREMLRMVLEHEGYAVVEAANGEAAVAAVREHGSEIKFALLDVQMPKLGGLEAAIRIRAIAPQLPILLGTGYVGDREISALREASADDLMVKPYDLRDLVERIARRISISV